MKEKIKSYLQKAADLFASRKKLVVVALIILVVVIFGARRFIGKEEQSQFIISQVERTTLVNAIQASGSIIASSQQTVTTGATGVIKSVFVNDGDVVKKGDRLAEIELDSEAAKRNASAYSSYISAVNSLKSANNSRRSSLASLDVVYDEIKGHDDDETLEMKETRTKAEVVNDNSFDSIKSAEAKLSAAWLDYSLSTPIITAPVSGEISDLMIAPGMVIAATGEGGSGHKFFSIVTGQEALISVTVSEVDVSQIETGQKVIIAVDAIANKTFTGKVVGLDRTGSVNQGVVSYLALIALDTSDKELLPNMSVTAEIILSSKPNVLTIPAGAVNQFQGNAVVSVLVNGQRLEKQVETGLQTPTRIEIISGLSEGDIVITGELQAGGEGGSQFGGQSRGGFGGGALRPGGFGGGGGSSGGDQH